MPKRLTPRDLRDPSRESGYKYVHSNGNRGLPGQGAEMWRAERGFPRGSADHFRGPARSTPERAAQDYCDHVNGAGVHRVALKTASHPRRKPGRQVPPEVAAAYGVIRDHRAREREEAQNYVYLIAEEGGESVKIGESAKPEARPGELQTGNKRTLILLAYYPVEQSKGADKVVHQQFAAHHDQNEWFRPTPEVLLHFGITTVEFMRRVAIITNNVGEVKAA